MPWVRGQPVVAVRVVRDQPEGSLQASMLSVSSPKLSPSASAYQVAASMASGSSVSPSQSSSMPLQYRRHPEDRAVAVAVRVVGDVPGRNRAGWRRGPASPNIAVGVGVPRRGVERVALVDEAVAVVVDTVAGLECRD